MLITIIIPTYNSSDFISKALLSVLQQTHKNFEVLIIDGRSVDDTVIKVNGFKDQRVRVYSEQDTGIYDAMNKGVRLAKGEWIYFLGSDDYLISIEVLKQFVDISFAEYDVVYGNVFYEYLNSVYDGPFDEFKILEKNICHQSIFFRKEVFDLVGYYDLQYRIHADWDHNMRWFLSDKLRHKHIDLVIAFHSAGGFSNAGSDCFHRIRHWNYLKYSKHKLTFSSKIVRLGREMRRAYSEKRRRDLIKILLESYTFIRL